MIASRSSILALLYLALAAPLAGQTIQGHVLDAASGEAVAQASVTVLGSNQRPVGRTRAGADGSFVLQLRAPGAYRLQGERIGYQAALSEEFEIGVRETLEVELRLSVEPISLDPLKVTARREPPRLRALENNGFYRREATGFGAFLRREDLERYPNRGIDQALDRVRGAELYVDGRGKKYIVFERAREVGTIHRTQRGSTAPCLPTLYMDGMRVSYGQGMDINDIATPEQIEAVELYRGPAETPQEFNSDAACGVIVIWSRSGR